MQQWFQQLGQPGHMSARACTAALLLILLIAIRRLTFRCGRLSGNRNELKGPLNALGHVVPGVVVIFVRGAGAGPHCWVTVLAFHRSPLGAHLPTCGATRQDTSHTSTLRPGFGLQQHGSRSLRGKGAPAPHGQRHVRKTLRRGEQVGSAAIPHARHRRELRAEESVRQSQGRPRALRRESLTEPDRVARVVPTQDFVALPSVVAFSFYLHFVEDYMVQLHPYEPGFRQNASTPHISTSVVVPAVHALSLLCAVCCVLNSTLGMPASTSLTRMTTNPKSSTSKPDPRMQG